MKNSLKKVSSFALCIIKLDPVKLALYHAIKEMVIGGAKIISKSTKNKLDDKYVSKLEYLIRNND